MSEPLQEAEEQDVISKDVAAVCVQVIKRLEGNVPECERSALHELARWLLTVADSEDGQNANLDDTAKAYLLNYTDSVTLNKLPVKRGSFLSSSDSFTGLGPVGAYQKKKEFLKGKGIWVRTIHRLVSWCCRCPSMEITVRTDYMAQPDMELHRRQGSWSCSEGEIKMPLELAKIGRWDDFDIFQVHRLSGGRPLSAVFMTLLEEFCLVERLGLDAEKCANFIHEIESNYKRNPYHNSIHAADVVQALGFFLIEDDLKSKFTDLELMAMLMAASVHDVGHPGVTNEFHVNTQSEMAILYNDQSVNENMHASTAFEIMRDPKNNALDGLTGEDYKFVRRSMINIVLATDMAGHKQLLAKFNRQSVLDGDRDSDCWEAWESLEGRSALRQMLMHSADISNPARPWKLSSEWSRRIMEEMFNQGDRERKLGTKVSPLCDRDKVQIPKSQYTFLEYMVKPCFEQLSGVAPKSSAVALKFLEENIKEWKSQIDEGVSQPSSPSVGPKSRPPAPCTPQGNNHTAVNAS